MPTQQPRSFLLVLRWCFLLTFCQQIYAQDSLSVHCPERILSRITYGLHLGVNLGGMAPLGIPDEVNSINRFLPLPGVSAGVHARYPLTSRWALETTPRFEMKRMEVRADVTHYSIVLNDPEGGQLQGVWTGPVKTKVNNFYLTLPVSASWQASRHWRFRGGVFFSYLTRGKFMGTVYDGYLRKDDPTGEKIEISEATYDFSPDLRRFSWGVEIGSTWQFSPHFSLQTHLSWGVNEIFKRDFRVLDFSMYPIYFHVGMGYTF